MNKQEAHQILDNYKSSSTKQINEALLKLGDLDGLKDSTNPYRALRDYGSNKGLAGPSEVQNQGIRSMSLWAVVRHWQRNKAADRSTESIV